MARKASKPSPRRPPLKKARSGASFKSGFDLPRASTPLQVGHPFSRMAAIQPGKERWAVKTGMDDDVGKVKLTRVPTTIEALVALKRPGDMLPPDHVFYTYDRTRADPVELTVFELDATVVGCKMEADGDFHIVINGDSGKAATMIAEIPDPDPHFVNAKSPWAAMIRTARAAAQSKLNLQPPSTAMTAVPLTRVNFRARIIGVGFFDRVHGQDGVAKDTGIELHPVLGIQWL